MTTTKPSILLRFILPIALILVWLVLAGVGGPFFGRISEVSSNDLTTFLPSNAESTKANEQLTQFSDSKAIPAIVVFTKATSLSQDELAHLNEVAKTLGSVSQVSGTPSPAIQSDDKKAAYLVVPLAPSSDLSLAFSSIRQAISQAKPGLTYAIGGPASFSQDLQKAFGGIDVTLLIVALSVVFVILLIVYRSLFLPVIVLLTSISALSAAVLVVWQLANRGVVQLNGQVQGILFILVIGAATDYSLLYLARLREELHNNESVWQATKASLKGSFESIIAAGGTVIVGLLCLLLSELGSNRALGPVGGIGIVFAIASALTFLPASLLLIGRFAFWPRLPEFDASHQESYAKRHPWWATLGASVQRFSGRLAMVISLILLLLCAGVWQLKANGVPQSDLVLGHSEARDAQAMIDAHFAGGSGAPAYIISSQRSYQTIIAALDEYNEVASVAVAATQSPSGTLPVGKTHASALHRVTEAVAASRQAQIDELSSQIAAQLAGQPQATIQQAIQRASASIPSVEQLVAQADPFAKAQPKVVDGRVLVEATLASPADSEIARDAIVHIRTLVHTIDTSSLVGGTTAIQYDTNQASLRDRAVIIPIVLLAITIILGLLLRSLIAPLILLATTVVSFGATLGMSAIIFNNIWHFPGTDPAVILFAFVFLVALGIDYNIFLMTRVREESLRVGIRQGTVKGLVVTGGVITSAGIVLASTFAALGVIPILFLAQIAFIVAFGVLLDTIIVRSVLVPALTLIIGRKMWWPGRFTA